MSGISLTALAGAGINPAAYAYADRILAGLAEMPAEPDQDLTRAIDYIKGVLMTTKEAPAKGRKKIAAAEPVGPQFSGTTPPDMAEQEAEARALVVRHEENAQALAEQLGYEGSLSVGALEDGIRFYQRRSVEACLELGKRLLILKELTPHGEFKARVELLGIEESMARRFMTATLKFGNRASTHVLQAASTQTKLLELLVLDDGEIEALEAGESARGLTLDEIDTMSVKELRAALREAKEEGEAKERILADKNGKLDELTAKLEKKGHKKADPWPDEIAGLKDDLHGLMQVIDEALGKVLTVIDAADVAMQDLELGSDPHQGYKTVCMALHAAIERKATLVASLREEFSKRLYGYIDLDLSNALD